MQLAALRTCPSMESAAFKAIRVSPVLHQLSQMTGPPLTGLVTGFTVDRWRLAKHWSRKREFAIFQL
jgi:hypothetical protein